MVRFRMAGLLSSGWGPLSALEGENCMFALFTCTYSMPMCPLVYSDSS